MSNFMSYFVITKFSILGAPAAANFPKLVPGVVIFNRDEKNHQGAATAGAGDLGMPADRPQPTINVGEAVGGSKAILGCGCPLQ